MSDLLPCPFCGGEAETTLGPIPAKWGARCKECDVWRDDRMASEKEAAMVWNTRAIPAADARAEALLKRAAQMAYEVWDDPEALSNAIRALIPETKP